MYVWISVFNWEYYSKSLYDALPNLLTHQKVTILQRVFFFWMANFFPCFSHFWFNHPPSGRTRHGIPSWSIARGPNGKIGIRGFGWLVSSFISWLHVVEIAHVVNIDFMFFMFGHWFLHSCRDSIRFSMFFVSSIPNLWHDATTEQRFWWRGRIK